MRQMAGPQFEARMALHDCTDDIHVVHRPRDETHTHTHTHARAHTRVQSTCVTLNCTDHEYNLINLINVLPARALC